MRRTVKFLKRAGFSGVRVSTWSGSDTAPWLKDPICLYKSRQGPLGIGFEKMLSMASDGTSFTNWRSRLPPEVESSSRSFCS
jgi:hypothetical protein